MKTTRLFAAALSATLLACSAGDSDATLNGPPELDAPPVVAQPPAEEPGPITEIPPEETKDPEQPQARCDMGRVYTGIGGRVLVSTRIDQDMNVDRARIKPYQVFAGEFQRAINTTPSLLSSMGNTFSRPAARWNEEPQLSAVTLYSAYRLAFQGCLTFTGSGTKFANAPTTNTATDICTELAQTFWSRDAEQAEIDACVKVAVDDTQAETNPRRRWAYTCASLLTTDGFLSY